MPSHEGFLIILGWQINSDRGQKAAAIDQMTGLRLFGHCWHKPWVSNSAHMSKLPMYFLYHLLLSAREGCKVASPRHRPLLPPRKYSWYSFCSRFSRLQGQSAARRIKSMKISDDTIGNRSRDLPNCSGRNRPHSGNPEYEKKNNAVTRRVFDHTGVANKFW